MQKQDTHSFCTTVTKIDDHPLASPSSPASEELAQIQLLEPPIRAPTELGPSEDDQKSGSVGEVRTSKKCYNQRCKCSQIYKKVKSRVQKNRYRFLCRDCYESYQNLQFCEFCEQIYGSDMEDQDQTNWVGCDNCERWNHITCQIAGRGSDIKALQNQNNKYSCLKCVNEEPPKKLRNGLRARPESLEKEYESIERPRFEQPKYQRVQIEWKKEQFHQLDGFLNNLSQKEYIPTIFDFKLSLSGDLVKYDINRLSHSAAKNPVVPSKI